MSTRYSFTESNNYKTENILNPTVLVEDGIVWDQEEMQVSLSYTNDPNSSLTENSEHYLTATDTHYFSVLENSNENILHDLNDITTACNNTDNTSEVTDHSPITNMCTIRGEPEIYQIEGTDELYAYEVAYDQDGNVQKFRYKLRPNDGGEYESVPESIELVLEEEDGKQITESDTELPEIENEPEYEEADVEEEASEENDALSFTNSYKFCIKQEYIQEDILTDMYDNLNESSSTTYSNDNLQVNEDIEAETCSKEDIQVHIQTKSSIKPHFLPVNKLEVEENSSNFNETIFVEINQDSLTVNDKVQDRELNVHHLEETCDLSNKNNENLDIEHSKSKLKNLEIKDTSQIEDNSALVKSTLGLDSTNSPKMIVSDIDDASEHSSLENSYSENSEEQFENPGNIEYVEDTNDNESDADEFQIVDGIHVTADTDTLHEDLHQRLEAASEKEQSVHQILSIQQQIPVLQSSVNDGKIRNMVNQNTNRTNQNLTYYIVQHAEKENLATINPNTTTNKVVKTNPRSILKSSFIRLDQKQEKEKPEVQKIEKKTIKGTEAYNARIVHNLIARTTIIHAPVRQQRLPRKQTIKPVERADEEIIVQEMVVSSNGFVHTSENEMQKSKISLKSTEIVHLSDSDDDYDPKNEHKRKKKTKRRKSKITEIVISDSEDESSDENIIHIDLSTDSDQEKVNEDVGVNETNSNLKSVKEGNASKHKQDVQETCIKKKRGRPPKRRNSVTEESCVTDESSSSKKKKNTNDSTKSFKCSKNKVNEHEATVDSKVQNIITKWKCKKCPKIFPSQGSLKTHMQYHNFHETKARDVGETHKDVNKSNNINSVKNIYQCSVCKETFKNNFLLSKHIQQHKSAKNFKCAICKKLFMDKPQLLNHKRVHIKEQMFKQTTLPKHSPKRNSLKCSKKINVAKCTICSKAFTSLHLLTAHSKIHVRFTCSTCGDSFISKLALEDHIRLNCVKQSKLSRQNIPCKSRNQPLTPLKQTSARNKASSSIPSNVSTSNNKIQKIHNKSASLKCDSCVKTFITYTAMFKHKVIAHGLETPDKNINKNLSNTTLHKQKRKHCSVPAGEKLRNAFSLMKTISDN